jgi:hypothetical protein
VRRRRAYPLSNGQLTVSPISRSGKRNNPKSKSACQERSNNTAIKHIIQNLTEGCIGRLDRYNDRKICGTSVTSICFSFIVFNGISDKMMNDQG